MTKFITNAEIVTELTEIKREILELKAQRFEQDYKEVSLFKAARMMNRGTSKVKELIKSGKLKARSEKVKTSKGTITRYRILVKDIISYQNSPVLISSNNKTYQGGMSEIAKEIINDFHRPKNIYPLNNEG